MNGGWKNRRFWKTAAAALHAEGGYAIMLDGRPVRTPAKALLRLPTAGLAEAVAAEWAAQGDTLDPATMPFTRAANSAIDTVAPHHQAVVDTVAAYGGTDLLCYRAQHPAELVARQATGWDPLLDWAEARFGARLAVTSGVMAVAQPSEALARLRARLAAADPFALAALHDLVSLSGSLVLGLAAAEGYLPPEAIWSLSRIDEDFQAEQWGTDEEAAEAAAYRRGEFLQAFRLHDLALR